MKKRKTVADIPELAAQWHPTKNGDLKPEDFTLGSTKKVWWLCEKGHDWDATIGHRSSGTGCRFCRNREACPKNCMAKTHPELAKQWHPTKNGNLTPNNVVAGSYKKVWWLCEKGHEWDSVIVSRKAGNGCRICSCKEAHLSNCLATTHPKLAAQWHPTKNGSLTPKDVTSGSGKKVWWVCENGHEIDSRVSNRAKGHGCRKCCGQEATPENCLAKTHPELAKQWHSKKNGSLTPKDVVAGSVKKVWWVCEKGHEWHARPHDRKQGNGCSICRESRGEKRIAEVLKKMGLPFNREIKFKRCRSQKELPFDFIVKLPNGNGILIEYQGIQHYKPIRRSHSWTKKKALCKFKAIQERDKIKSEWARKNKIPLLVIPYWDYEKIPELISDFLNTLK